MASASSEGVSAFTDPRHALYVGAVVGIGLRHGVPLAPILDDDGNYTNRIVLGIPHAHVTVTLVVPPPPDDWQLEQWAEHG